MDAESETDGYVYHRSQVGTANRSSLGYIIIADLFMCEYLLISSCVSNHDPADDVTPFMTVWRNGIESVKKARLKLNSVKKSLYMSLAHTSMVADLLS